jgi:hypothetical protein
MPVYEPVGGADEASIEVSSAEDGAVLREGWFRAVTQRSWSSAMMHVQSDADSQTHSEPLWLEVKETGTLTVYSDRMKRGPHDPGTVLHRAECLHCISRTLDKDEGIGQGLELAIPSARGCNKTLKLWYSKLTLRMLEEGEMPSRSTAAVPATRGLNKLRAGLDTGEDATSGEDTGKTSTGAKVDIVKPTGLASSSAHVAGVDDRLKLVADSISQQRMHSVDQATTVWVTNIPLQLGHRSVIGRQVVQSVSEVSLKEAFRMHGNVVAVALRTKGGLRENKSWALVTFRKVDEAREAMLGVTTVDNDLFESVELDVKPAVFDQAHLDGTGALQEISARQREQVETKRQVKHRVQESKEWDDTIKRFHRSQMEFTEHEKLENELDKYGFSEEEVDRLRFDWLDCDPPVRVADLNRMSVVDIQEACGLWQIREWTDGEDSLSNTHDLQWTMLDFAGNEVLNTAMAEGTLRVDLPDGRTVQVMSSYSAEAMPDDADADASGVDDSLEASLSPRNDSCKRMDEDDLPKVRRFPDRGEHESWIANIRKTQNRHAIGMPSLLGSGDWAKRLPDIPKNPLQAYALVTCSDLKMHGRSPGWRFLRLKLQLYSYGLLGLVPFLYPVTGETRTCFLLGATDLTVVGGVSERSLAVECAEVDLRPFAAYTCVAWIVLAYLTFACKCQQAAPPLPNCFLRDCSSRQRFQNKLCLCESKQAREVSRIQWCIATALAARGFDVNASTFTTWLRCYYSQLRLKASSRPTCD